MFYEACMSTKCTFDNTVALEIHEYSVSVRNATYICSLVPRHLKWYGSVTMYIMQDRVCIRTGGLNRSVYLRKI